MIWFIVLWKLLFFFCFLFLLAAFFWWDFVFDIVFLILSFIDSVLTPFLCYYQMGWIFLDQIFSIDFIMVKQREGSPLRILPLVCCHRSRLLLQIVLISVILLQSCSCSATLNQIATRIAQHSSCTLVANKDYSFGFQNVPFIFRKLYFRWYFWG